MPIWSFLQNTYEYQSVHCGCVESSMVVEIFPCLHQLLFVHLDEHKSNDLAKCCVQKE